MINEKIIQAVKASVNNYITHIAHVKFNLVGAWCLMYTLKGTVN